jgi:hypothetical protein
MGRNRKFELGEIVRRVGPVASRSTHQRYVVVGYEPDERRYRVIPLDYKNRRRGDAAWMQSWWLMTTNQSSGTASIKTYRANEALPERGCSCQCCIHTAYSLSEWTNHGGWRELEEPTSIEDPGILGLVP